MNTQKLVLVTGTEMKEKTVLHDTVLVDIQAFKKERHSGAESVI